MGNVVAKVATEAFLLAVGGKMIEVPYKGSAPNIVDLLGGRVQVSMGPVATLLPYTKDGKLRILAVTDSQRSTVFPEVPTIAESGVPGYAYNNWHAIVVPAATRKEIVAKLHDEIVKAAKHPDVAAQAASFGVGMIASTPEELQKRASTEREYWTKQIKTVGIKVD